MNKGRHERRPGRIGAKPRRIQQTVLRIYWWSFALRATAGLTAYALTLLTDVVFMEDALFYEEMGYLVAREWLAGVSVDPETLPDGARIAWLMVQTIAVFYYLLGGFRALPLLIIAYSALTAVVPVYVYRISLQLGAPDVAARRAAWLVVISPAFAFWSGSLYKEGLTLLFLGVGTHHTLHLQARWRVRSAAVVGACVVGLWGVRYYLAIVMAFAAVAAVLLTPRRQAPERQGLPRFPSLVRQVGVVSAFVGMMAMVAFTEGSAGMIMETDKGMLVELDTRRAWSAQTAASGYLREATISTPRDALEYFPAGLFYFLVTPLPWQVGALRQNLIIPETAFWLVLYLLLPAGVAEAQRSNRAGTLFVLILAGGMCVIYALLVGNIGTAYRMRSQVWLLFAPFAGWGWGVVRERRRRARAARVVSRRARVMGAGVR